MNYVKIRSAPNHLMGILNVITLIIMVNDSLINFQIKACNVIDGDMVSMRKGS